MPTTVKTNYTASHPPKVGDRVKFSYYDSNKSKQVEGRGNVKSVDELDNYILVQTTRRLHYMQPGYAELIPLTQSPQPMNSTTYNKQR